MCTYIHSADIKSKMLVVYLVRVWYVDRFAAFGHVSDDARAPRYVYFFFLFHLLQRGPRTHVKQFGHQTLGLAALKVMWGGRAERRLHRTHVGGPDR